MGRRSAGTRAGERWPGTSPGPRAGSRHALPARQPRRGSRPYDRAMKFGAAFWIQRTGWPDLRDACLAAEAAGFDSLWLDDHLLADEGDWHDAKLEGWAALSALAPLPTGRLRLLFPADTFPNPRLTPNMAAAPR